jgi:hypothetical protein
MGPFRVVQVIGFPEQGEMDSVWGSWGKPKKEGNI